jgi:hypothetical protein
MTLRWLDIRTFNNSQNSAFEELVCQLAREEEIADKVQYYRIAAPDGGVEAYCVLANGDEYGWQAKYFSGMGTSQWDQIEDSYKTALKKHPCLVKYYVCVPLDRQDPRIDNQSWFMDRWNAKVAEWKDYARTLGRNIEFEYWGSSELIHRLSLEKHAGRKLFWFSMYDFSDNWFENQIEKSIENLGGRYTEELNVELEIATYFNAACRNDAFRQDAKRHFNALLISLNKFAKEFEPFWGASSADQFRKAEQIIRTICASTQAAEIAHIDIESLQNSIQFIRQLVNDSEALIAREVGNKQNSYSQHTLQNAWGGLNDFALFFRRPSLRIANTPNVLLAGEAGIGKSHLLADIALNLIKQNKSCVLLLGQHFVTEEAPWTQILRNLLRLNCDEKQLLGALNAKAEAQGERLLLMIDAINEGRGKYFWPDHIRGFINDFAQYPWIGLVLSVRTSYQPLLIPEDIGSNKLVEIHHQGFQGIEYQASSRFFRQYGIQQPRVPLLNPEFGNPLFLKLFCEGIRRSGLTSIPTGFQGITKIFGFFIGAINKKLAEPKAFDYPENKNLVDHVIKKIVEFKLSNKLAAVTYDQAFDLAEAIVTRFSNGRRFLDVLISEGILSKNIFSVGHGKYDEQVYLAYERLDDYFTASFIIDSYPDIETLTKCFQEKGSLSAYIVDGYLNQGIVESLSTQLPERLGCELYELVGDQHKSELHILEAFVHSLIWRRTETFSGKLKDYINQYVLCDSRSFSSFFQMVYMVGADTDHPYNADFLHRFLMPYSLAERDAFWTTHLHEQNEGESSAMCRLIDWAILDEDKAYLSNESRLLAAKALAWLFTSTNIRFRDSATKALVVLLENYCTTIESLLTVFQTCNDPYVVDRVFAASYGAVLRSEHLEGLGSLAEYIVKNVFTNVSEVYPHVLVRDYARNIVEYALYKQLYELKDASIIRPPYRSEFPSSLPGNAEIDAYKFDYNANGFKKYFFSQNEILSSMTTEYGRGTGGYGDFGRYTFEASLYDWDCDANGLSNYACKLIFEKFGYDVEQHGEFDRHAASGDRHQNKSERIGKKYQWIALYEILARLADNHQMIDESTRWGDEKQTIWYSGPWNPSVRNIDPTVVRNGENSSTEFERLVNHVEYTDWTDTDKNWLGSSGNLPYPKSLISVTDSQGIEWLVLENDYAWEEPSPLGQERFESSRKHLWYQLRSCLVKQNDADRLFSWLKNKSFMNNWFPTGHEFYQMFSREFFWSPAYRFFENPYYGGYGWKDISDREYKELPGVLVMPTAEGYRREQGVGEQESSSCIYPCQHIFSGMKLEYSKNIGEWRNCNGEIICLDPSVGTDSSPALVIRKDALQEFLSENDLQIFWTCLGEKNILGTGASSDEALKWLELSGAYRLSGDNLEGEFLVIKSSEV